MNKIFLYLYPIEEYINFFLYDDDFYHRLNIKPPLPILNECIEKRYRAKGYQIIFLLYPDKKLYGLEKKENDRIIYTDIVFTDNSAYDDNNNPKKDFIPKYPNLETLFKEIGPIDNLIIGGFHFSDCVKRVGEYALNLGINVLIDLDLTDLFFGLYKIEKYFDIDNYNPLKYKEYWYQKMQMLGESKEIIESHFNAIYNSPIYGIISKEETKISR